MVSQKNSVVEPTGLANHTYPWFLKENRIVTRFFFKRRKRLFRKEESNGSKRGIEYEWFESWIRFEYEWIET